MARIYTYLALVWMSIIHLAYMQDCPQDVVFIVDRAAYIQSSSPQENQGQNWNLIKLFLNNLLGRMRYGIPNTQLATVTFGDNANVVFNLNTYPAVNGASTAISNLDYMNGGGSNVADAFRITRTNVLQTSAGKRVGVPSICLFLVTYPPFIEANNAGTERDLLKNNASCRLIVLGVAEPIRLPGIATTYSNYANAGDYFSSPFTSLNTTDIVTQIINSITFMCPTTPTPTTTPTTTTTTLAPPIGCTGDSQIDVAFILDSSGSIGAPNFEKAKAFVGNIIRNLNVDNGRIRVALTTFSDNFLHVFGLDMYNARGPMLAAINNVTYLPGTTNTASALDHTRTVIFSGAGDRQNAPNLVVLITDGGSNNRTATATAATMLRSTGASILVIGVGSWLYEPELYAIAGYPASTIRTINDYDSLNSSVSDIVNFICQSSKACTPNGPCQNGGTCVDTFGGYVCQCPSAFGGQNCEQPCRVRSDIVFAIDAAWCLSYEDFKRQLEFVRNVTLALNDADTRVGLLVYSNQANVILNLGDPATNRKLNTLKSVSTLYTGGETNITAAIVTARDQMFTTTAGDRTDAPNILVIITGGQSQNVYASVTEATKARNSANPIQIVVVAIGIHPSRIELEGVASYPVAKNVFMVPDFASLNTVANNVIQTTCNNINECVSSPCQNGGTCTDLLNGYQCACDNTHTGANCERASSGIMDIVFAFDISGTSDAIVNFSVSVVENLEISQTKTRVGVLVYAFNSTTAFELNASYSKQDIIWGLKLLAWIGLFNGGATTTNTASAMQMLRDKFTPEKGDRAGVQNFALFFTNINSNVNAAQAVPSAIDTRLRSGGIYIITFGIGTFADVSELVAISSVAGYPVLLAENNLTVFRANKFSDMPTFLNPYLNALIFDQNKCSSNPCQNGGTCINDVKKFICQCQVDYGGETCSRRCARQYDVAIILDTSGSGDFGNVVNWNINFARQIVLGLPIQSGRVALGVVVFGNGANVSFNLNTYSSKQDILNALSFTLSTGPNGLQNAFQLLPSTSNNGFFSANRGGRGGRQVAVVITSSDSPYDFSGITQAAAAARNANIEVYAVALGDGPNMGLINSIASNSTYVYTASSTNDIARTAENLLNTLCQ